MPHSQPLANRRAMSTPVSKLFMKDISRHFSTKKMIKRYGAHLKSHSEDQDQTRYFVGFDMDPNCL